MDEKRLRELAVRSKTKNIYTYTDFLNESTQREIESEYKNGVSFWGGADFCERKIARFGDGNVNYTEEFPIKILKISVVGEKFSRKLTHRDVLGTVMSCGIERDKVGDVFVGEKIYVAVYDTIAEHLLREIKRIGPSNVEVELTDSIDGNFAPSFQETFVTAQSNRLDALISKLYNISREAASELISLGKVFVDGVICEKTSASIKPGETVSVRGKGKFRFDGENGTSRKGKTYFKLSVYK